MTVMAVVAVVLTLVALVLVIALRSRSSQPLTLTTSLALWCPVRHQTVTTDVRVAVWDGRLTAVERCPFCGPDAVTCDTPCLSAVHQR